MADSVLADVSETENAIKEDRVTVDANSGVEEVIELFSSERMVFFSDAVIAISMTLLILPLLDAVQTAKEAHLSGYEFLKENVVTFASFLLSFFMTIMYWRTHESLFHNVRRYTEAIRIWNPFFLLFIVTLPITTSLDTEISDDGSAVAPGVYVANLIIINLVLILMHILVRKDSRMWDPKHIPPTSYGLLILSINFLFLSVVLVIVCVSSNPNLLYLLFLEIPTKPLVRYFDRRGDLVHRFGKMIDRYVGLGQ
jgi:uncharacterized membrane protein